MMGQNMGLMLQRKRKSDTLQANFSHRQPQDKYPFELHAMLIISPVTQTVGRRGAKQYKWITVMLGCVGWNACV